jgi:hypothetical protein
VFLRHLAHHPQNFGKKQIWQMLIPRITVSVEKCVYP